MNTETPTIPQYGKSMDPATVDAVRRFWAAHDAARDRLVAFAKEHSAAETPGVYAGLRMGHFSADGITGPVREGRGRWKRQGRGWAPYKNNPLRAEFVAAQAKLPEVPGLPAAVMAENYFMSAAPFIWDGAAWSGFSHAPTDRSSGVGGWVEALASEFHRAKEGYLASRKNVEVAS